MSDAPAKHFGYLIAYVLPGFVTLWGVQSLSPMIRGWLSTSPTFPAGLESVAFVTLASVAAGMTVSAARWLIIDTCHAWTGLPRPTWNDATLNDRLPAFEALVDAHFRYYQFYANMAVAVAIAYFVSAIARAFTIQNAVYWTIAFISIESLFLVTSRDNLGHYYRRATRLLGEHKGKEAKHVQRSRKAHQAREADGAEAH
jgi:hypothetical protein